MLLSKNNIDEILIFKCGVVQCIDMYTLESLFILRNLIWKCFILKVHQ